ncbi:acylphosphatase [Clostridium fallax]|uniref:Acylphosphatase n=1 Tax=Clostridium fallax TaxID=1533 RepID=A0A1M4U9K4_9CLOT|nr:acylphosphatase [Clostridium fallax]SHE53316.1 acylphosphatase [Clostridium fallax]SQB06145.1 acylphosphatase AcyP [Clostridium fallax]
MIRYHMVITGKVQGVGFRFFVLYTASPFNLTGYVKNLSNGDVEIEAQGNPNNLMKFLSKVISGNNFSVITDYSIKEIPIINDEKKFNITY